MKKYIKPVTEAVELSKEALMWNIAGSTDGSDTELGGKLNNGDDWDDFDEEEY